MTDGTNGHCGTCAHFGSDLPSEELVQVRVNLDASADIVSGCNAPSNISVHLRVTALGSCDAWSPAAA